MHTCSGNYLGHSLKYVKEKTDKVQYSLQLGDTVCAKKLSTIWRCPLFGKKVGGKNVGETLKCRQEP